MTRLSDAIAGLEHRSQHRRIEYVETLAPSGDLQYLATLLRMLQGRAPQVRAAAALGLIGHRDPDPALRQALPLLRPTWFPLTQEDEERFRALQWAVRKIEEVTGAVKETPVPAGSAPRPGTLPIPGTPAALSPDRLPVTSTTPESSLQSTRRTACLLRIFGPWR